MLGSKRLQYGLAGLVGASVALSAAVCFAGSTSRAARAHAAYVRAVKLRSELESQPARKRSKAGYERVINEFRAVFYADPAYTKAPVAAEAVGDLYAEMGRTFSDSEDFQAALKAYQFLISQYPQSSMARDASFSVGEVYFSDFKDNDQAAKAFHAFLDAHPDDAQAPQARKRLKQIEALLAEASEKHSDTAQAADESSSNSLVEVTDIHDWVGPNYTRVVIGARGPVKFNTLRLSNPDRIVFDLPNTYVSQSLNGKNLPVQGGFLRQIRVGQFKPTVTRIVLDLDKINDYSVFPLPNPFRLIVDVHGQAPQLAEKSLKAKTVPASATASAHQTVEAPARKPEVAAADRKPAAASEKTDEAAAEGPKTDALNRHAPEIRVASGAASKQTPTAAATRAAVIPVITKPASPTGSGSQTLTRALGLKVARIVIDPGHGGHDTGTIGPTGLREKDVALDVALRLKKLIETQTDSQVIMTRTDDTFIPLEERTAIANEKDADLFISIHCNASHSSRVRGIETYYLNFTSDPEALELAARENATSQESVHQLQDLIKKIALSDKIEESQEFARDVQKELYKKESKTAGRMSNRGVRKAPFVVLIGANMPSILAEISFLSNSRDERLLKKPSYREQIAEALFHGIENYTSNLGGVRVAQSTR